ncbi:unnamed protein product [Brassica oleracea]
MANSSILLTDLKDRRCSSSVDVRLLGFLEARNVKLGGTHSCFDKETYAGKSYFYKLVSKDTENTSAASLLRGYAKVEPLTMADLNEFIITAIPKGLNASSRLFSMFLEMSPGTFLRRWKVSPTSLKCPSMAPSESGRLVCAADTFSKMGFSGDVSVRTNNECGCTVTEECLSHE